MGCLILKDTSLSKCEVEGRKPVHSFLENFWLRFFIRLAEAELQSCIFTSVNGWYHAAWLLQVRLFLL